MTSSNILHGSANPIGGQNQVIKLRWGALPEQLKFHGAPPGIKFALGENVKQSNWGNDFTTRYPQTRMGVDEIIADAFERATAYSQRWQDWRESSQGLPTRVDLELEALAEVVAGKRWTSFGRAHRPKGARGERRVAGDVDPRGRSAAWVGSRSCRLPADQRKGLVMEKP